ncbi:PTS system chitobiose-specific transporter subunit IIC [Klebsiella pneumoniae]|uniref:PTS system chitobiose-specific transporter subunit IIC n=1 Tax=Klebsiella pneumoniae TaxID=573 RepID=A0A2X3GTC7_KLEPN|nr:PTS system chitobiose-specific transporter subunit IIC [Klebsiella pneumoniae]
MRPSEAGKQFHFWAKPMLDSYILLGGSGATLGLIIAIFIASRRADHRQVAKLALPSGIFQINEPILFGLPIIMNPVMFIPFVLVQPILAAITLAAYSLGIIPPVTNLAPWTMPTGLRAFFNSNGSVAALLVALVQPWRRYPWSTCRLWCCRIKRRPLSSRKRAKKTSLTH